MSGRTGRPRSRVQRLRRWLLASAVVFATLLVTLVSYTRYRARRALLNLPHQLGIDIKSETDSFTISRTVQGRTLFTIHAAKAIQHKNGITTLRDVAVTLYGPPGSNRTDSIRGGEFEYDQANGIVRAMGDTLLDVGIADGSAAPANAKRLTMQSRGLVFLQKLGVASTREQIRFQYGASQGEAVGADYEMDTGVLTLQHDVHLHSTENGHAERIDAASAKIDRNDRIATLLSATLTDANDSMQAPHMLAFLRAAPDEHAGTLERVDATGGVILNTGAGQRVQAPELHADLTPGNQLSQVEMKGGVHLQDDQTDASSQHALLRFSGGHPQQLTLTGAAHVQQNSGPGNTRTLDAAEIESPFHEGGGAHLALGELHATGNAKLVLLRPAKQAGRIDRTELTAPTLVAHPAAGARTTQIQDLQASRGTRLLQVDGAGTVRTSTSDSLSATFASGADGGQPSSLASVVQQGHVTLHEIRSASAAQPGSPARSASQTEATADHADFQAATDLLVLTGAPHVASEGLQIAASRITVQRDTGDAEATGAVRGSVSQLAAPAAPAARKSGDPDTTEFAAESARLARGTGAVLLQGGNSDARLWSATGQVEAPAIEINERANTLHAYGDKAHAASLVKTVLTRRAAALGSQANGSTAASPATTRIFSRDLLYRGGGSGKPGTADFHGSVRLLQGDDVITADTVIAAMEAAGQAQRREPGSMLGSGVRSVVAEGRVRLQQGSRTATGTHLLYSAGTRDAVLTGTPGQPPVVRDPLQGTLTGTELTLHVGQGKGDNQVQASGAPLTPVHTELEVPDKQGGPAPQVRSRSGRKSRFTP